MQKLRIVLLGMGMVCSGFFVNVKAENLSNKNTVSKQITLDQSIDSIYNQIEFSEGEMLSKKAFKKAYIGYLNLKGQGLLNDHKNLLSIADFSLSANKKRFWVIDLATKTVLFHTLVAHGQGTGEEFAHQFSNKENSHESSIGFYITDNTYTGHNGYSLRLNGMDKGYNSNALERAIVMHGADYVSETFIKGNKRLGRSWGCPAVPSTLAKPIINAIKDSTCLYIYYPDKKYLAESRWLKTPEIPGGFLQQEDAPNKIKQSPHTLLAQRINPENGQENELQYKHGAITSPVSGNTE